MIPSVNMTIDAPKETVIDVIKERSGSFSGRRISLDTQGSSTMVSVAVDRSARSYEDRVKAAYLGWLGTRSLAEEMARNLRDTKIEAERRAGVHFQRTA